MISSASSSSVPTALAFDCGSSSVRAILGNLVEVESDAGGAHAGGAQRIEMREVARMPHRAQKQGDYLVWDIEGIAAFMRDALRQVTDELGHAPGSVGIDTWGVDYALLDEHGELVHAPRTYRDARMQRHAAELNALVSPEERWGFTGVATSPITTVHQVFADLAEDQTLRDRVSTLLPLAEYFAYLLGAAPAVGRAIASTTEMAEPGASTWSAELLDRAGIPASWLPNIVEDRSIAGTTTEGIAIVRPGGHDTACAVHASGIAPDQQRLFVSAGSWSLIGARIFEPQVSEHVMRAGLTNEVCTDSSIRLLRNLTGLWLLQECQRIWGETDTAALLEEAAAAPSLGVAVDPDAAEFVAPENMPDAIDSWCESHYGVKTAGRAQMVRLIIESLACAHANYAAELERVCGEQLSADSPIHIIGGASRGTMLTTMTASACGRPVIVGAAEASALGNLLAQFEAVGAVQAESRVQIVEASAEHVRIEPGEKAPFDTMREKLRAALAAQ